MNSVAPHCRECGALLGEGRDACWLCGADVRSPAERLAASPRAPTALPRRQPAAFAYSLSTLLLLTTLVAVVCALVAAAPGLGIMACLLLAPVLLRTMIVVRRRESLGRSVSTMEKVSLGLTSYFVAIILAAVVCFATFGAVCTICLTAIGLGEGGETVPLAIFAGLVTLISIVALRFVVKWIRARFRRDMEHP